MAKGAEMGYYKRLGDCSMDDLILIHQEIRTKDEILSDADYAAIGEAKDGDLREERERQAADNRASYDWALRSGNSSGTDFSRRVGYGGVRRAGGIS